MSTRNSVTVRAVAVLATLTVVAGACSSDEVGTADQTTPSTAITSEPALSEPATTLAAAVSTTEAATTTQAATTTTVAPTTTTEPPLTAASLTLAGNGVLPFVFGDSDGDVIAGLTTALGAPEFDGVRTYPTPEDGYFVDTDAEQSYIHPIGRYVCFSNELCAEFGGPTVDTLTFTGWDIAGDVFPLVFTAEGVTVGSVMSDFVGVVDIVGGGCYTVGYVDLAGVELTLLSTGEPFGSFDLAGNYVIGNPDPADVTVLALSAGDLPYFLFEDC